MDPDALTYAVHPKWRKMSTAIRLGNAPDARPHKVRTDTLMSILARTVRGILGTYPVNPALCQVARIRGKNTQDGFGL